MHPNEALVTRFYEGFSRHDSEAMLACYHPKVEFSDPVFQHLEANEARAMWQMLVGRSQSLKLTFNQVRADDQTGSAHWEAIYAFSKTGRTVHNIVEARFSFKDGLIYRHDDKFDLWKWAGMALGTPGKLLGWSPPLQSSIRKQARAGLNTFMAQKG